MDEIDFAGIADAVVAALVPLAASVAPSEIRSAVEPAFAALRALVPAVFEAIALGESEDDLIARMHGSVREPVGLASKAQAARERVRELEANDPGTQAVVRLIEGRLATFGEAEKTMLRDWIRERKIESE